MMTFSIDYHKTHTNRQKNHKLLAQIVGMQLLVHNWHMELWNMTKNCATDNVCKTKGFHPRTVKFLQMTTGETLQVASEMGTTRYLNVVCIYGAICLQILFLKHHIMLFCHEILKYFA